MGSLGLQVALETTREIKKSKAMRLVKIFVSLKEPNPELIEEIALLHDSLGVVQFEYKE